MPFQFPPGPSPADEDQAPMEAPVIMAVYGNCGQIHPSVEDWAACRACHRPKPFGLRFITHMGAVWTNLD